MKKQNYLLLLLACYGLMQTACKKDEPDVTNNTTTVTNTYPATPGIDYSLDTTVRLNYTVMLVSGTSFSVGFGKKADDHVAGAKVVITQAGVKKEQVTDADGMATFTGFFKGALTVSVTRDDLTSVKYIVTVNGAVKNSGAGKIDVANIVPVFRTKNDPLTARITGRVTYQTDLTNTARETVPQGTQIVATIDVTAPSFFDTYLKVKNPYILDSLQSGKILHFAYEAAFLDSTDASGNYAITIPASVDGLPFKITVPELAASQKYYENATVAGFNQSKTVRALFSELQVPSPIPPAGGAAVVFVSGSGALASASVSGSGQLDRVNITNGGTGYTSAPRVLISGGGGSGATATATVTNGVVTAVTITNPGTGYTSDPSVSFVSGSGASVNAVLGGGGRVQTIQVVNGGSGYASAPSVTVSAPSLPSGTQAAATANINAAGVVTSVTITDPGSGYTSNPSVTIAAAPAGGTNASATAQYSGQGVQSFTILNGGANYTGNPAVTFSAPDMPNGTRAQGIATIDANSGMVTGFTITNPGSGYLFAPSVSISSGSGATASASYSGRGLTGITVLNPGDDYTSAPRVRISGGGGSGAAATAIVSNRKVVGFTITNPGSGYTSAPSVELISGSGAQASVVVTDGKISGIQVVNGGSSYTGAPEVIITPNPSGAPGAGATATASVDANGAVTGVTITAQGTGYLGGNVPSIAEPFSITPSAPLNVKSGSVLVRDIHLGTGHRMEE